MGLRWEMSPESRRQKNHLNIQGFVNNLEIHWDFWCFPHLGLAHWCLFGGTQGETEFWEGMG